jgi:8-oxo-dGTP pyrophosphatase MutT (NUDIX family)
MERVGSEQTYEGKMVTVQVDSFRYPDGSVHEREIVAHPGAVAIVAHDDELLFMVRQPREPVGEDALLELPAGKLDVEGEPPLECARRELEEEVGLRASEWRELKRIYSSPGFTDEQVHIFEATGLERVEPNPGEGEQIEIVEVPLGDLDRAIERCTDAKSLVGLLLFRGR